MFNTLAFHAPLLGFYMKYFLSNKYLCVRSNGYLYTSVRVNFNLNPKYFFIVFLRYREQITVNVYGTETQIVFYRKFIILLL